MQSQPTEIQSAREANLVYVSPEMPGITRLRRGKAFSYQSSSGKTIKDSEVLARIKSLVIPPAWESVWICAAKNGHLQAVGRDARGRKQYRYHPKWTKTRDETKYDKMISFAEKLPAIRRTVAKALNAKALTKEKVLATVVTLLDVALIRVGNDEYARTNKSFGLTTMKDRHVKIRGATVTFDFIGKSGVHHRIDISNRRLAKIVKRCRDLPGQALFQYVSEDGKPATIHSHDVNEYLHQIAGDAFTAKDFRTWSGTVLAVSELLKSEVFTSQAAAKKNIVAAIDNVASKLGNTRAVCKKCYIHPEVLSCYLEGNLIKHCRTLPTKNNKYFSGEEATVLRFLKKRLA